jgi:ABC-type glycerol-3-phosphate transport system substrate-binding protein
MSNSKFRRTAPIFLLGLALTSLVGCQNSSSDSDVIKITFWHTSGASLAGGFETAATEFEALVLEHEGVKVEVTPSYQGNYDDIENKVTKGFATGTVPTIAIAYPDAVADFLALDTKNKGYVCNLSSYAEDSEIGFGKESWFGDGPISDFVPAFYNEGSKYGKEGLYSLPFMKSSEALFYNYDRVAAYGKNYTPEGYTSPLSSASSIKNFMANLTWDQLIDFCRYIKSQSNSSQYTAPLWYDSDSNLFITESYQRDIPYTSLGSDGTLSIDFNNDAAKSMVSELKQDYDDGLLVTKGTQNTYGSDAFKNEKCVFSVGSTGGTDYNDPGDNFTSVAVKVPYANDNPLYVSQGPTLCVLNSPGESDETNSIRSKYAFKFIKYLTSTEVNAKLCVNYSSGYTPVRTSCYSTDLYTQWIEDSQDSLSGLAANVVVNELSDKYFTTPAAKGSSTTRDQVGGIITNVLLQDTSVESAFQSAYQQSVLAK